MEGQILIHSKKVQTKDDFIVVYLQDARGLFGNLSNTAMKLLALIWRDCEFSRAKGLYPGNTIELRKPVKEVWTKELNIGMGALNNILTQLIKDGILIEQASPIYTLDPKRFFKGSSEHRRHAIEVIYKYEIEEGI